MTRPSGMAWTGEHGIGWPSSPEREAIATARLLSSGKIGRTAVEKKFHFQGIGAENLRDILKSARDLNMKSVSLHSQSQATRFYEKFQFLSDGEEFLEADILHVKMCGSL